LSNWDIAQVRLGAFKHRLAHLNVVCSFSGAAFSVSLPADAGVTDGMRRRRTANLATAASTQLVTSGCVRVCFSGWHLAWQAADRLFCDTKIPGTGHSLTGIVVPGDVVLLGHYLVSISGGSLC
jgi:hypothetical protein